MMKWLKSLFVKPVTTIHLEEIKLLNLTFEEFYKARNLLSGENYEIYCDYHRVELRRWITFNIEQRRIHLDWTREEQLGTKQSWNE